MANFKLKPLGIVLFLKSKVIFFTYVRPYNSLKTFLRSTKEVLFKVKKENNELRFTQEEHTKTFAFFDVRKCDLKALQILDKVFLNKDNEDEYYKHLRQNIFIVAVNCIEPSGVCFCKSMDVSFEEDYGADIVITELKEGFLIETKTQRGKDFVSKFNFLSAKEEDLKEKSNIVSNTVSKIKKRLDTDGLKDILYQKIENEYWEILGKRCFSCMSCTNACPTCFCFNIVENNSADGLYSERIRVSDSCFNPTFATVHKFNLRDKVSYRYRHWLLHKMAYWQDQFGTYGCVGCGRCITWCPAKIDIAIETQRIRNIK